jgi:hypothetical protein
MVPKLTPFKINPNYKNYDLKYLRTYRISKMKMYILSFCVLFSAELLQNLHTLFTVKSNRQAAALTGAISSALWCLKILIICNQPLTIITAFVGAYLGSLCAWKIGIKKKEPIQ